MAKGSKAETQRQVVVYFVEFPMARDRSLSLLDNLREVHKKYTDGLRSEYLGNGADNWTEQEGEFNSVRGRPTYKTALSSRLPETPSGFFRTISQTRQAICGSEIWFGGEIRFDHADLRSPDVAKVQSMLRKMAYGVDTILENRAPSDTKPDAVRVITPRVKASETTQQPTRKVDHYGDHWAWD